MSLDTQKEQTLKTTDIQNGKVELSVVTSDSPGTLKMGHGHKNWYKGVEPN